MCSVRGINPDPDSTRNCPVCRSALPFKILHIHNIPVLYHGIWEKRDEALSVERGDIDLVICLQCGHVYNQEYDPLKVQYTRGYENSLHYSPHFQNYSNELAKYLINRYSVREKKILEIGSGSGHFLRLLCDYGNNTGIGFDPGHEPTPDEKDQKAVLMKDQFQNQFPPGTFDLIVARHVLEHLFKPSDLVHALRTLAGGNTRTPVYIEVPDLDYIFRKSAIWDVIYEHYSYFSKTSLERLFLLHDFHIENLSERYHGQYLSLEAIPGSRGKMYQKKYSLSRDTLESLGMQFGAASREKIKRWKDWRTRICSSGKKIVLWGAGSKGVNFLNILAIRDEIEYVVDVNPKKQFTYIAGTGQQIVPPSFLKEYRPEVVIVMNQVYENEIRKTLNLLDITPEFLYA
jgi:SAM-dependent methyltransferase